MDINLLKVKWLRSCVTAFHSAHRPIRAMKLTSVRTVYLGTSAPLVQMGTVAMLRLVWAWKMPRTPNKIVKRLMSVKRESVPVTLMLSVPILM